MYPSEVPKVKLGGRQTGAALRATGEGSVNRRAQMESSLASSTGRKTVGVGRWLLIRDVCPPQDIFGNIWRHFCHSEKILLRRGMSLHQLSPRVKDSCPQDNNVD